MRTILEEKILEELAGVKGRNNIDDKWKQLDKEIHSTNDVIIQNCWNRMKRVYDEEKK